MKRLHLQLILMEDQSLKNNYIITKRQKTSCSAYMSCGGCQYLNISYEEELKKNSNILMNYLKALRELKQDLLWECMNI